MKRNLTALTTAALLTLALTACGSTEPDVTPNLTPDPTPEIGGTMDHDGIIDNFDMDDFGMDGNLMTGDDYMDDGMDLGTPTTMEGTEENGIPRGTSNVYGPGGGDETRMNYGSTRTMMDDGKYQAFGDGTVSSGHGCMARDREKMREYLSQDGVDVTQQISHSIDEMGRDIQKMF